MSKCITGSRCVKCRKLNFKNAVKEYQKTLDHYLIESAKDEFGNLLIHPSKLKSLLAQRAKLGRIQRNIQNKIERDKLEEKERNERKEKLQQEHMTYFSKAPLSESEEKDLAYWERNMIALRFADGWYYDTDNNWDGWKRVLSLDGGKLTFHIPDDFPIGNLLAIDPNWDGQPTEIKWSRVEEYRGIDTCRKLRIF